MNIDPKMDPTEFWEQHYEKATSETSGRPTAVLEKFVTDRTPGAALELGCGKGDDAVNRDGLCARQCGAQRCFGKDHI